MQAANNTEAESPSSDSGPGAGRRSSRIGMLVGLIISAALLWYVFVDSDFTSLAAELAKVEFKYLLLLTVLLAIVMGIRAQRWRALLPPDERPSFIDSLEATMLGFFASYVLPLRAGEFIRPLALKRFSGIRFSVGFASIINERVFDVLSLFVFLGLCLGRMPSVPDTVVYASVGLAGISAAILVVVALSYLCPEAVLKLADYVLSLVFKKHFPNVFKSLFGLAEGLVDGLRAVSSFKTLLEIVGWSILLWFMMGIFYLFGLPAMGSPAAFWPGMMVNVMVALAVAAPSAPGFIGTFQFGCVLALSTMFGYSKEFSIAYSIVIHAFQAVVIIGVGLFISFRRGLRITEIN